MASQKPNLNKNFTLRGESFKDGMLLLIKHLDEQDWKLGNKFSARSNLLSKKIETLYKEFKDDLENEKVCSFEAVNSDFDNLIASYITLLNSHTTLKDPLQSLRDAECCAVWKKGREHFDTHFLVDNTNDRNLEPLNIVLSETPYTDSDILRRNILYLKPGLNRYLLGSRLSSGKMEKNYLKNRYLLHFVASQASQMLRAMNARLMMCQFYLIFDMLRNCLLTY